MLQPDWGLTAQIRGRYFHSSEPGEFDYFSPKNFIQIVPTLQLRGRRAGWRYVLAAGLGAQWETGGGWRQARAPQRPGHQPTHRPAGRSRRRFAYSNTPTGAGYTYDYRQFSLGLRRLF